MFFNWIINYRPVLRNSIEYVITLNSHMQGIESSFPMGTSKKTLKTEKRAKRMPKTTADGIKRMSEKSL